MNPSPDITHPSAGIKAADEIISTILLFLF
jgi:hypothetical protein